MERNLIKEQQSFKMTIPASVEAKIRRLLLSIYNTEWSGILFYKYEGSIADKDLHIVCQDLLPLNIGNSTFTEFEMSPKVANYMAKNDLLDCQLGLIHSHHSMPAFFSGTDTNTLSVEGSERHNFVSLIVNNEGSYCAAVTWKEDCTIKGVATTASSFFGTLVEQGHKEVEYTRSSVHYAMLDITTEHPTSEEDEFGAIIMDLKQNASRVREAFNPHVIQTTDRRLGWNQPELPFDQEKGHRDFSAASYEEEGSEALEEVDDIRVPEEIVDSTIAQIVTGSLSAIGLPTKKDELAAAIDTINKRWADRFNEENPMDYDTVNEYVGVVIQSMAMHIGEDCMDGTPSIEEVQSALASAVSDKMSELDLTDLDYYSEICTAINEFILQ